MRQFLRRLHRAFGPNVPAFASVYFGVKGLAGGLAGSAALPLFMNHYGVTIERFQAYSIAVMTPWSLKPLFGLLSDGVPICGRRKLPYMFMAALVGTWCLGVLGGSLGSVCAGGAAGLLFGVSLEIAVVDLLAEAKYAELMAENPETKSDLASFVWACTFSGSILAAVVAGPMADAELFKGIFVLALVPAAQVMAPLVLGMLDDPSGVEGCQFALLKHRGQCGPAVLSAIMAAASLGLTAVALAFDDPSAKLGYSLAASGVLIVGGFKLLPQTMARCNLYMFLASASYLSLPGALDYFYTAPEACVPGGPHFDMTYYIMWSSIAGGLAALGGITLFQTCFQDWRLRPLFWFPTVLRCAAAAVDLVIIMRWNVSIGVSDKVMFMLGNNIVGAAVTQLDRMPAVILTSRLCPRGSEAIAYALMAGFQNFGGAVSSAVGSALTSALGVEADLETNDCHFEALPLLVVASHVLLPVLVLPLTFLLIPNVRLDDALIDNSD